jgi:hypothetical protein
VTKRAPTRESVAGQTYLALRRKARDEHRTTDELIQLHALEAFIDRLTTAAHGGSLIMWPPTGLHRLWRCRPP